VVNVNDSASELFGREQAFPVPVAAVTGVERATMVENGEIEVNGRLFAVSITPLTDQPGGSVGELLVLYDITTERQREQQLSVLNRVLRHNLRNEMTVIRGRAETIQAQPLEQPATHAESIVDASDRLLSIADNIRSSERVLDGTDNRSEVDIAVLCRDLCAEICERYPGSTIDVQVTLADSRVRTDPDAVELALENLVENAVVHAETDTPAVTLRLCAGEQRTDYRILVSDSNPKIPDIEQLSLQAEEEQPLQHGQGLGLWTVNRCISALQGDLRFEYDEGNTVTLVLPRDAP